MRLRFGVRDDAISVARASRVVEALRAALDLASPTGKGEIVVVPVTVEPGPIGEDVDSDILVAALRVALVSGECDAVIHDAAALPSDENPELTIAAYLPAREPRTALCTAGPTLADLPPGARVVARSSRIRAQVARLREDLVCDVTDGDVPSLLALVERGDAAGAAVGLADLNLLDERPAFVGPLSVDDVVPASGQGAVAIEMRADAPADVAGLLTALDDPDTRIAIETERAAMSALGAGPSDPVSAYAVVSGEDVTLHVRVTSLSGGLALNDESTGLASDPAFLGANSAKLLLGRGAARVMTTA